MKILNVITILFLIGFSCKKPPNKPITPGEYEDGILVLNEGLFEQNNASLSFYDGTDVYQQVFKAENNRGLGDTANDFETYNLLGGQYIIVAVDVSSQIEIIDRNTLESIAQIPVFDGVNAREPRRIVINGTLAYVCNFDGTVAVIDLISHSVTKIIEVGANPDGMVAVDNRLFVSNSGGLNFPVYDSTMSVINMENQSLETTFETRINSSEMVVDSQNEVYLVSRGNYDDVAPALLRINANTYEIIEEIDVNASSLNTWEDDLYFYNGDVGMIQKFNMLTESVEMTGLVDVSGYDTFFGMQLDVENERIYCFDANGYVNASTVKAYSLNGAYLFEFTAGLNAKKLIFN